jgi:hypothetical protein
VDEFRRVRSEQLLAKTRKADSEIIEETAIAKMSTVKENIQEFAWGTRLRMEKRRRFE